LKRVGYIAGALGLTPMAMGALTAAAAPAQAAVALTPNAHAKMVSLQHSGIKGAPPKPPDCLGNTRVNMGGDGHITNAYFRYANSALDWWTCLGTTYVSVYWGYTDCKDITLTVTYSNVADNAVGPWTKQVCEEADTLATVSFVFRSWIGHVPGSSLELNVSSTFGADVAHTFGG
jgi:hypothetical protein